MGSGTAALGSLALGTVACVVLHAQGGTLFRGHLRTIYITYYNY